MLLRRQRKSDIYPKKSRPVNLIRNISLWYFHQVISFFHFSFFYYFFMRPCKPQASFLRGRLSPLHFHRVSYPCVSTSILIMFLRVSPFPRERLSSYSAVELGWQAKQTGETEGDPQNAQEEGKRDWKKRVRWTEGDRVEKKRKAEGTEDCSQKGGDGGQKD